jgi:hypothetical protein
MESQTGDVGMSAAHHETRREGLDDRRLVALCLAGDERAWEAVVHRYAGLVYGAARRAGRRNRDAAVAVDAVFRDLLRELPELSAVSSLRGWISAATRRAVSGDKELVVGDGWIATGEGSVERHASVGDS